MRRLVAALALLAACTAQAPCDVGYTFYPDLEGTEEATMNATAMRSAYSGSCIKLTRRTDPQHPVPTQYKSYAAAAQDFCAYTHAGGHLLSFSSLSRSPNGMLATLARVLAPATTPLVLVGGMQSPAATRIGAKWSAWVWSDAATSPAIINSRNGNWGVGQPEYVCVARARVRVWLRGGGGLTLSGTPSVNCHVLRVALGEGGKGVKTRHLALRTP